jgi:phage terminase large subunit GpA-like protein
LIERSQGSRIRTIPEAGLPHSKDVWQTLRLMIADSSTHSSGAEIILVRIGINTGFATQEDYAVILSHKDHRSMVIKGQCRLI